jgi:proline iminopeptidase
MDNRLVAAAAAAACLSAACGETGRASPVGRSADLVEVSVQAGRGTLYARAIGRGRPVIVLHGGPDFDHGYLLPELDQFGDAFRLIYYDQRGRGSSAEDVRPEDVTLASELADLDRVRQHFSLEAPVLLGHSWGTVLALEYALRHSRHISHLVLMNPAPASASDRALVRKAYLQRQGADMDRQRDLMASTAYQAGDPETVAARYRIHFKIALTRREHYERLMARMTAGFARQGSEGIVKARAIEERLYHDTWQQEDYDLHPRLRRLQVPTLVIAGGDDFIPIEVAEHIAGAIPGARLVAIPGCGHFAYLECPADVRNALDDFFQRSTRGEPGP